MRIPIGLPLLTNAEQKISLLPDPEVLDVYVLATLCYKGTKNTISDQNTLGWLILSYIQFKFSHLDAELDENAGKRKQYAL